MKEQIRKGWEAIPEQWQSQVKKASLAALIAGGTVMVSPLINPFHQMQRDHLPRHTAGHVHSSVHQGKGTHHWKGGHARS